MHTEARRPGAVEHRFLCGMVECYHHFSGPGGAVVTSEAACPGPRPQSSPAL